MRTLLFAALVLGIAATSGAQHQGHEPPPAAGASPQEPHQHPGTHDPEHMTGFFGRYPMTREASGTSWQPDSTPMQGRHFTRGDWMLMAHASADLVYDRQGGPRGEADVFAPTMGMLMAQRPAGRGTLGLRGMLSLEPATMGREGYPLILQTGETADGLTPLIDRQHPHDLLMELAASYSVPFREHGSVFGYLALPGEPALGPPTFMHRFSGMALPESPLMHHWIDSTHITFGVLTAGAVWRGAKVEVSSFTGREPDDARWDVDRPRFDSYSARVSLNVGPSWALQLSAGHLNEPEQLEPGVDIDRVTASATYNRPLQGGANWQATAVWGRNRKHGENLDGLLLESAWWSGGRHTVFARGELVEKDELGVFEDGPLAHEAFDVGKLSAGYVYDVARRGSLHLGVGGLASVYALPQDLEPSYGDSPVSFMVFLRGVLR
jgi:hypothetical protein